MISKSIYPRHYCLVLDFHHLTNLENLRSHKISISHAHRQILDQYVIKNNTGEGDQAKEMQPSDPQNIKIRVNDKHTSNKKPQKRNDHNQQVD